MTKIPTGLSIKFLSSTVWFEDLVHHETRVIDKDRDDLWSIIKGIILNNDIYYGCRR